MCMYPNTSLLKKLYLAHYRWHYGFTHGLWGLPTVIRKSRIEWRRPDKKKKALFPAGWHAFKNPMSFPSTTKPNIWLNEEAAEHDNVILVQARELERNNTKWEVVFGNETSTSLNRVENSPNVLLQDVCCIHYVPRHGDSVSLKDLLSVIGHGGLSLPVT